MQAQYSEGVFHEQATDTKDECELQRFWRQRTWLVLAKIARLIAKPMVQFGEKEVDDFNLELPTRPSASLDLGSQLTEFRADAPAGAFNDNTYTESKSPFSDNIYTPE